MTRRVYTYDRGNRGLTETEIEARAVLTRAVEKGEYQGDEAAAIASLLQNMLYDDMLVCGHWSLELLYLDTGKPHFRLYKDERVYGVADIYGPGGDIGSSRKTPQTRRYLAAYLVACGWTAEKVIHVDNGALTPMNAEAGHMYRLFKVTLSRKSAPRLHDYFATEGEIVRRLYGA
jgi:hypothetical protein